MMTKLYITLLLLFSSLNCFAFEQSFSPQENLTVGDRVVLSIKADGLNINSIDKNKVSSLNFGDFELLDVQGGQTGGVDFILTSFKAGKVELLSVDIPYTADEQSKFVKTKAVPVDIKSVLNPQKPSRDIYDIKGIFGFSHGFFWYAKLVAGTALFLSMLYFLYRFIRKRMRKPTKEEIILAIPPKEYALTQLNDLKALNLIEKGQIKDYYDKLSDILRYYLSRIYNIDGLGKTTNELFVLLKNKAPSDYNRELKNYLLNCDFVKFAKVIPVKEDIEQDFNKAKNFVERI